MEAIAAGKGKRPKPFMMTDGAAFSADAVWDSSKGLAAEKRVVEKRGGRKNGGHASSSKTRKASVSLPDFVPPQLCESVERPPNGPGWVHEIKFDGYRIQLRVEASKVSLKTRKGLDWTVKFGAIAEAASDLPDGILDGEIVALDANGAPDFAALQAALSEVRTEEFFFAFDLLHDGAEDLRKRPLSERKNRLQNLLAKCGDDGLIRFVEHFETGGEAVLRSACRLSLEGIVSKKLDAP